MKKTVLTLICATLLIGSHSLIAQKINIGVNANAGLPLGDFGKISNIGFGGDLSFDYYFNDKFDLGIEGGYRSFLYDSDQAPFDGETVNLIPILVTAGYHMDFDDWLDLYGELGGGVFIASSSMQVQKV